MVDEKKSRWKPKYQDINRRRGNTKNEAGLTFLQERFKNNVLEGMNFKEAYLNAGYKCKGTAAKVNAHRLMKTPAVIKAIAEVQERAKFNTQVTLERILEEEKCIAFSNVAELFKEKNGILLRPDELPEEAQRAIAAIEIVENDVAGFKTTRYKYKFWDKGRSLERIGKHLGMFEKDNAQKAPKVDGVTVTFVSADGKQIEGPKKGGT